MTNLDLSLYVFSFLKKAGVRKVVVCAGARNAPLVLALESQNFKVYSFFEERSASFFALGLIKSFKDPVAILTTSGTAVAELLPAAIEATYQSLPLVIVSADRPKSYRGTGAPQTIEQPGIFSKFVENVYDLDANTTDFKFTWSRKMPLHLNVSFDEPLIDKRFLASHDAELLAPSVESVRHKAVNSMSNPLIILGEFDIRHRDKIKEFILRTRAPVFAESLSHLRNEKAISDFVLHSSDQIVQKIFKSGLCSSVIRIGGVPTLRFWRDLEADCRELPVLNFSESGFSGLSRPSGMLSIDQLVNGAEFPAQSMAAIREMDEKFKIEKKILLGKFPLSEQSLCHQLSLAIGSDALYLGNSLPIRHWDQFAHCGSAALAANRGANGIDGQVSTYLGWSENQSNSYCLIGDLTAMYDLAALGLTPQLNSNRRCVIVINNFGGQIFNRVFKNDDFINSHDRQFFHWAQMWGWNYLQVQQPGGFSEMQKLTTLRNLVEIIPDSAQTAQFWTEWDDLWLKA